MAMEKCKCGNALRSFDFEAAEVGLYADWPGEEPKYKVDLILRCPDCGLAYNSFIPLNELMVLEGE